MSKIFSISPFSEIKERWQLHVTDVALKHIYVDFVFLYNNRIEFENFDTSLRDTLSQFQFFHGVIEENNNDYFLSCSYKNEASDSNLFNPVLLEFDHSDECIDFNDSSSLYGNQFISRLLVRHHNVKQNQRPLLQIKVTNFNNASTIGISWCHVVCDFKGIYDFIFYLSGIYNKQLSTQISPVFSRKTIWEKVDRQLVNNNSEIKLAKSARNRIVIISKAKTIFSNIRYLYNSLFNSLPVIIEMNTDAISAMIAEAYAHNMKLTANDIINASILKLFIGCMQYKKPNINVGVYFPIDIRNLLGVHDSAIANCLGNISGQFPVSDVNNLNVFELAKKNRSLLDNYNLDLTVSDLQWAEYWRKKGVANKVYHHWFSGLHRVYSSNWATFDMTDNCFGDAKFVAILRSSNLNQWLLLPNFYATILPHIKNEKLQYIVRMSINKKHFKFIKDKINEWPTIENIIKVKAGKEDA